MADYVADPLWPSTLRSWRTRRGLSVRELAARVPAGKSSIARLEAGTRAPTRDIAARLDEVLETGGELATLVPAVDEHDARLAFALARHGRVDAGTVDALASRLASYRTLEDTVGAAAMLPAATAHLTTVEALLRLAWGPHRTGLVGVSAQWAQWTGWLHLARGQAKAGLDALGTALAWATEAEDREMAATVLSFRGYAAEQSGEVGAMIGIAEALLRDTHIYVGQRAYDRHMLARGYALSGERALAREALAGAVDLAAESAADSGERPPWHYYRSAAYWALENGLVWRLLGEQVRAADCIAAGLAGLPAAQRDAEWTAPYREGLGLSPN